MGAPQPRARRPGLRRRRRRGGLGREQRRVLAGLLAHPRYEVLPLDGIVEAVLAAVPREVKLTVTVSPKQGLERTLAVAEELSGHSYAVVPHLSARLVRDHEHLGAIVARLQAAGVREVFVIAGDAAEPAGEFAGAADLLVAMGEQRERFEEIGISGYPESHHLIPDEETIRAMTHKATMATHIVSQICFDAEVIAGWIGLVRARGTHLPIWIGVPGSVDQRRLLRISLRIGLGQSARFLASHRDWLRVLAFRRRYTPDRLMERLAPHLADPAANVAGFHVYTFNDVAETERWRRALLAKL